ncbi:unnamed protein product [Rhizophagus irregularis]|nr:unnamed protein product [Rhizophagus irregularis]
MEEELSEDTQNSEFTHDNCNDKAILSNEDEHVLLYTGKRFELWDDCEDFVSAWAKRQGFRIIKDRVVRDGGVIRCRTYICSHGRTYDSTSAKDTTVLPKKLQGKRSITNNWLGILN